MHIGFWDLRIAMANEYGKGRMFVAGDAAHSHPPYGGYGINTGLEDAVNLGWKLDATFRGWAGPRLLHSYDAERRPVFASTAKDFIEKSIESDRIFLERFDPARNVEEFDREWSNRQSGARAEVRTFEPHYEGSPIIAGCANQFSSAVGSHDKRARVGHHLTPRVLSTGKNVFEELGLGFTLIQLAGLHEVVANFQATAKALGIPLKIVVDITDATREFYEVDLILVRPDQFIAWTSDICLATSHHPLLLAIGGLS
jgi:hypothetical protein